MKRSVPGAIASLLLVLPASAQVAVGPPSGPPPGPKVTVVETFDDGSNVGGWSFFGLPGNPVEVHEPTGGNPGWWLHATCAGLGCLDTVVPNFRTQSGTSSVFTGDYRAAGVVSLGIDLRILGPSYVSTGNRPLSLVLSNDGGTPSDPTDDVAIARVGHRNIPRLGARWSSYRLRVPASRQTIPAGWQVLMGTGDDDADWNKVITDVSQVRFLLGDPNLFYIFQQWEIGVDNVSIRRDPLPTPTAG